MAKKPPAKKKPGNRPARAPKPEPTQQDKDARAISQLLGKEDAEGAAALTRQFFPEGSLGRVSSGFDENGNRIRENQDVLDRARAAMEAYGPGGGARRSSDVQNLIDRSRAGLDRSAETQANLDRTKANIGRSAEDQALLDQAKGRVGRTAETSGYLNRLNAATEGYNSAENQGMLEQQMRGINQGFQEGQQRLANNAGKMGIRGGTLAALAAKNQRAAGRAEAEARQDLFVKNADEKQKRLLQYGDAVSGAESAEQDRFKDFGNAQFNIRDAEERRGNTYNDLVRQTEIDDRQRLGEYGGYVAGAEADEYGRERDTRTDYYNNLKDVRGDELNRQQINLDRTAAERAGQNATYFGGLEYSRSRRDADEQRRLNRDYFNLAKSQYGGGRSRGQTGRGPTSGAAQPDPRLGFFDEAANVINKY